MHFLRLILPTILLPRVAILFGGSKTAIRNSFGSGWALSWTGVNGPRGWWLSLYCFPRLSTKRPLAVVVRFLFTGVYNYMRHTVESRLKVARVGALVMKSSGRIYVFSTRKYKFYLNFSLLSRYVLATSSSPSHSSSSFTYKLFNCSMVQA